MAGWERVIIVAPIMPAAMSAAGDTVGKDKLFLPILPRFKEVKWGKRTVCTRMHVLDHATCFIVVEVR